MSQDRTDSAGAPLSRAPGVWPSPVVALNRAVPLAMAVGPEAALAEVDHPERDGRLAGYQYLPAVKPDLLSRFGRIAEAAAAYRQALT